MKKGILVFISLAVVLSFVVVITSDFWRTPNSPSILLVEIEPKKGEQKRSSSDLLDDLKENFKEKINSDFQFHLAYYSASIFNLFHYQETLPTPELALPDLPPEIV